jgi:hypothetical protein
MRVRANLKREIEAPQVRHICRKEGFHPMLACGPELVRMYDDALPVVAPFQQDSRRRQRGRQ